MRRDAAHRAREQAAPGARQPQAVGAPVGSAPALDQRALFQLIEHADHRGAVAPHRLGEAALGHSRVGIDVDQQADAPGRQAVHARGEIPEHGLLREAQAVTEQLRQRALFQFLFVVQTI